MIPFPNEFIAQIEKMLGAEAPAFFGAMEQGATLALRLNPLRNNAWAAAEAFVDAPVPWEPLGHYLKPGARPGAGIAHAAGAFYLQEASAMLSAAILDPRPGERVLDLCAAPGGKSTQLLGRMAGEGLLISNEPEPKRAKILASNLERMGAANAAVVNAYPDALASRWAGHFDALLCDAPCSGEGMFRRTPEARLEWNPGSPAGCAKRQAEILDQAAKLLRPGGRLVYSTCTFNSNENEETIAAFLARHPDFTPEDFEVPGVGTSANGCMRIWPHKQRGDGHFAAKLRKAGDGKPSPVKPSKPDKEVAQLLQKLEKEIGTLPEGWKQRAVRQGDRIISLPEACPDMRGLKVVSPGLWLCRIGRSHVEPEHALAMAADPARLLRRVELRDEQAARYLLGEALEMELEKGWTLALWHGLPLGWGKASGGYLKNHNPVKLKNVSF